MKNNNIKSVAILLTVVLLVASSVNAGMRAAGAKSKSDVKVYDLELYPAKQTASQNLRLLPDPNELNANAVDLYNKALNALPIAGGTAILKAGNFMLAEGIHINRSNVTLMGEQGTFLKLDDHKSPASNTGVKRFFFQGCSIYDNSGYGFWLRSPASDSPNNTIIGCVFENNTLGCIKEDPGAFVYQAANICR